MFSVPEPKKITDSESENRLSKFHQIRQIIAQVSDDVIESKIDIPYRNVNLGIWKLRYMETDFKSY